jgi:hypothetical protein
MTDHGTSPSDEAGTPPPDAAGRRTKLLVRLREDRLRSATALLFTAGAVLMPLGLFAVGYGWYGAATTKYAYDQFPYLLSGGLTGVCLTTIGGFLYFGAWIAKGQADQRDAAQRLDEHLRALPERLARQLAGLVANGGSAAVDPGAELVVAGEGGASVHRRDCRLVAARADLRPYAGSATRLTPCRVCRPVLPGGFS